MCESTKYETGNYAIPQRLETKRLFLRFFQDQDWHDLHGYYSDPECMRYTIGKPLTEGESWRMMAAMVGHWQIRGYGPYAIELKKTSRVIGVSGLWYPNDWPEPEIKWGLVRARWGNGYASEASRAVKKMASSCLPNLSLISLIFSENLASQKVALALGARFERKIVFREKRAFIYRHNSAACQNSNEGAT